MKVCLSVGDILILYRERYFTYNNSIIKTKTNIFNFVTL